MVPEKRRTLRLDFIFPVRLKSNGFEGVDLFTRDLSTRGAFIRTSSPLVVGVHVELLVTYPTGELYLNVPGKVVRVENDGMAIQFIRPALNLL
jgi:hypothetical protein